MKNAELPQPVNDRPELPPIEHPSWCTHCDVEWMQMGADSDRPDGWGLDGHHSAPAAQVLIRRPWPGCTDGEIVVKLSQYTDWAPTVTLIVRVDGAADTDIDLAAPDAVDELAAAMRAVTAPLRDPEPSRTVNTAPREHPMHWIARADITDPVWDQHRGVVVMPSSYTDGEMNAAMVALVRERNGR